MLQRVAEMSRYRSSLHHIPPPFQRHGHFVFGYIINHSCEHTSGDSTAGDCSSFAARGGNVEVHTLERREREAYWYSQECWISCSRGSGSG